MLFSPPLLDGELNVYVSMRDGVRKFDRAGNVVWFYHPGSRPRNTATSATLHGNALYGVTSGGLVYKVGLSTGEPVWEVRAGGSCGSDDSMPLVSPDGVLLVALDTNRGNQGNSKIVGLDPTSGRVLWRLKQFTYNFHALFPGDGTAAYMDPHGGMHRISTRNGSRIWSTPDATAQRSFTDGGAVLGPPPQHRLYSCSNPGKGTGQPGERGLVRAYALLTGDVLWSTELPHPCNSFPAVHRDQVIVPAGAFLGIAPSLITLGKSERKRRKGQPRRMQAAWRQASQTHERSLALGSAERRAANLSDVAGMVMALDARDGRVAWQAALPPIGRIAPLGDEEGALVRVQEDAARKICLPAQFGPPTVLTDGTVFVGRSDGKIYQVRPPPTLGSGPAEVRTIDVGASVLPAQPTVWAPGIMAVATCDDIHVFNTSA